MATYLEIHLLYTDNSDLRKRTDVAVVVSAEIIRSGDDTGANGWSELPDAATAHGKRLTWAQSFIVSPDGQAVAALKVTLAQNRSLTVSQINGASDASLQTAVNKAVDLLAGNEA